MEIGVSIKRLRIKNGLTQQQLAEYLNVSMQTVSRWETSVTYPDIFMLPILSKRFNVTVDYLLKNGGSVMKTIESNSFRIREWNESDAFELQRLALRANYLKFDTANDSLNTIKTWIEYQEMFPVIFKETGKLIGIVGLVDVNRYKGYKELEVHVCDDFCDVDYITELHKLILDYGFNDTDLLVAFALCYSGDETLVQAMKNVGFVFEGTLRKFGRDKRDSMRYSIMKDEYFVEKN